VDRVKYEHKTTNKDMQMNIRYVWMLMLLLSVAGCEKDGLLLDREESPVLITFSNVAVTENEVIIRANFYELDKTNILDHNVGIDSIPLAGLPIKVFVNTSTLVGEYTTDGQGQILFNANRTALAGASRLEWVGNHKGTNFRKLYTVPAP